MVIVKTGKAKEFIKQLRERGRKRDGIHVSDLVYCLRKAYFRKVCGTKTTDRQELLYVIGTAMHYYFHPNQGETTITVDGISCTPDVLDGIEIKSTRQSSAKFDLAKNTTWLRQAMAYCKAMNTTTWEFLVFFICGDWKPPFPQLESYTVNFTKEDVEENWKWLVRRRDVLVKAFESNTPPSLTEDTCAEWECAECEASQLCEEARLAGAKLRS